jgi:hypothetical protein
MILSGPPALPGTTKGIQPTGNAGGEVISVSVQQYLYL